MSLAWGSLIVLLLLLPGVLFFVGLYMPETFSREMVERSALGQLSVVIFVSFIAHTGLGFVVSIGCPRLTPCVNLGEVVRVLTLDKPDRATIVNVGGMLDTYVAWIVSYIVVTSLVGTLSGYVFGKYVVTRVPGFVPHRWVHDLRVGRQLTVAYVMTSIRQEERVVMYHGFLKNFALKKDGCFAYLILTDATRGYMMLQLEAPMTSLRASSQTIGDTASSISKSPKYAAGKHRALSYFMIEGEDIANVVFDRFDFNFNLNAIELEAIIRRIDVPASTSAIALDS